MLDSRTGCQHGRRKGGARGAWPPWILKFDILL